MGSTSKSTTDNNPPSWAKDAFSLSGSEAPALYKAGVGGNVFPGQAVSPLSGTTMQGVNQLARAGANTNTAQTRPLLQGIGGASVLPSYSEANLGDMASGKYLKDGNPYFDAALQGQLDSTASQVQSQFSGAGRYGSGANTDVLTKDLGSIRSGALRDQFNADTSNMLTANGQMDSSRNAGLDRALQATSAMGAMDQNQFQNKITGAGATLQAGGLLDAQSQKQLSDLVDQWTQTDNSGWNRLGLLEQAASGAAGPYGVQNSRTSSSNPLAAIGAGVSAIPKK